MIPALARLKILILAGIATVATAGTIEIKKIKRMSPVDFDKEIYPILKASCIACHNKTTSKAELNLETPEDIAKGGESGKALIPGKGRESLLVRVAAHIEDPDMPPRDNKVNAVDLTSEQLGLLSLWIDEGAKASPKVERKIAWEPLPQGMKSIYAAALTPDGQYAACSRGGQVYVYHVPTRQMAALLTDDELQSGHAHRTLVPALAFSPDGKRLASGSYREIKLWRRDDNVKTEQLPADPERMKEIPASHLEVAIPAAQQHFSGAKNVATLWDAEKKNKVREVNHGAEINAVAASADGKRIATSGVNNSVKLWDAATGALIAELRGSRAANSAAALANRVNAFMQSEVGFRTGELRADEAELANLETRVKKVTETLKTVQDAVPPKVKLRDEAAAAKAATEKEVPPPLVAGAPAEDAAAAKKRKDAQDKLTAAEKKLAEAETEVVRAQEAVAHQELELKLANEHVIRQGKAIADDKAAIANAEQKQKAAEAEAKKAAEAAGAQHRLVRALTFSPDGNQLATAADDGQLHLWSGIDGTPLRTLPGAGANPAAQRALTWDRDAISVTAEDGSRTVHQLTTEWSLERTLGGSGSPFNDRVNALRFSPDGKTLAAGSGEFSRSGELTIWNVESGALEKTLTTIHKDALLALSYSIDGRLLATGSADKAIRVLDTTTWATVKSFEGHTNHVLGLAWRAESRTLVSTGADNSAKVWDLISGDRKRNIEGWDGEVTAAQFIGYTNNFLAASADKRLRLMNDNGGEVRNYPGNTAYVLCAAASDDGGIVIAGGQDGTLRIWDGNTAKPIEQFPAP